MNFMGFARAVLDEGHPRLSSWCQGNLPCICVLTHMLYSRVPEHLLLQAISCVHFSLQKFFFGVIWL